MRDTSNSAYEIDRNLPEFNWRISSSCSGGNCVEVGAATDGSERIAMRQSRDPDGPILLFTRAQWLVFVGAVKRDEFDLG